MGAVVLVAVDVGDEPAAVTVPVLVGVDVDISSEDDVGSDGVVGVTVVDEVWEGEESSKIMPFSVATESRAASV